MQMDITQHKPLEEKQRFLAEASRVLAASLDYQTTLERVARLALPALADICVVDLFQENGLLRDVVAAHVDPTIAYHERMYVVRGRVISHLPGAGYQRVEDLSRDYR